MSRADSTGCMCTISRWARSCRAWKIELTLNTATAMTISAIQNSTGGYTFDDKEHHQNSRDPRREFACKDKRERRDKSERVDENGQSSEDHVQLERTHTVSLIGDPAQQQQHHIRPDRAKLAQGRLEQVREHVHAQEQLERVGKARIEPLGLGRVVIGLERRPERTIALPMACVGRG